VIPTRSSPLFPFLCLSLLLWPVAGAPVSGHEGGPGEPVVRAPLPAQVGGAVEPLAAAPAPAQTGNAGESLAAAPAPAQVGAISVTVRDRDTGEPVAGAGVRALGLGGTRSGAGVTGQTGRSVLRDLPAGEYVVTVDVMGYESWRLEGVTVEAGAVATVEAALTRQPFQLNPLVVSASKRQDKALEAPASVSVVGSRAIEERPAVSPVDHLRGLPAVDVIQHGVQAANVVTRGFNNPFSGSLHMLTDYRLAHIPSLRANLMHFIPATSDDLERVEVVLGPGSALYGPNTASGVVHFLTRSPLLEQGTAVSVAAGFRGNQAGDSFNPPYRRVLSDRYTVQTSFRTAHLLGEGGNLGLKLSGQVLEGNEWIYVDAVEVHSRALALARDPDTRIGLRDFGIRRYSLEARADWAVTDRLTTVFTTGTTVSANAIELVAVGAAQARDWRNSFYQLRANRDELFAQVYLNASSAGGSYLLRDGATVTDNSRMLVAQLQHARLVGRADLTYGVDVIHTMPETGGTIHGVFEDEDVVTEAGAYLQVEAPLAPRWDLILAGRVDHHSHVRNLVPSPRAALVFKPADTHNLRFTYNRAFSSPSTGNLFLDLHGGLAPFPLDVLGFHFRAQGTGRGGYAFMQDGQLTGMRSPFASALGAGPGDLLPVQTETLWRLALRAARQLNRITAEQQAQLAALSPGSGDIGINLLDLTNQQVLALGEVDEDFFRFDPVRESITQTLELGYKGLLGQRLLLALDGWYERRSNFVSPLIPVTPLLLLDGQDTRAWLERELAAAGHPDPAGAAAAAAAALEGLPAAVVSSRDVNTGPYASVLATVRNFGQVDLWGADLGATLLVSDRWQIGLSGSLVSNDAFCVGEDRELGMERCDENGGDGRIIALNAPARKAAARINYRNDHRGIHGEILGRYTAAHPVSSPAFSAGDCDGPGDAQGRGDCVAAHFLFDVNLGYRFRGTGLSAQLALQNVLNTPYRSFIGVPELGRFTMLRLRYEL
jgi:outer membrane receptor for ferrienterochelin and colicins